MTDPRVLFCIWPVLSCGAKRCAVGAALHLVFSMLVVGVLFLAYVYLCRLTKIGFILKFLCDPQAD
jgi:hypothetical protein